LAKYLLIIKRLFSLRVEGLGRLNRVMISSSLLFSLSSLLEAAVLIGLVAFATDSVTSQGLEKPSTVIICIALRLVTALGATFVMARDSRQVRETLSLTMLERFNTLPWVGRTALDPADIRMMTLVLPQDISNARHGLTTSTSAAISSGVLAAIALAMSPTLILPVVAGIPFILLPAIRRGRKTMRLSSEANGTRFHLSAYNEILPFGFDELRPQQRLRSYENEYQSLVKQEATRVFQLKMVQARGPIGLTTSIYVIFFFVLQIFSGFDDAENLASLLVLMRVLLNLQSVLLLPGFLADYLVVATKFESGLDIIRNTSTRNTQRQSTGTLDRLGVARKVPSEKNLIELNDVHVEFSGQTIVGPVSMKIPHTGLTLLWGPSGSGKTTIARVLMGDLEPSTGTVLYSDQFNPDLIRVVPQSPAITEKSLADNIAFWLPGAQSDEIKQLITRLKLDRRESRAEPGGHQSKVGLTKISGGERLRVGLGRAVLGMKSGLLIVDEPTASLDSDSRKVVLEMLQLLSQNISVVVISHDDDFKLIADQQVELSYGK